MKLLFVGGTGNISTSVTRRCLERGDEVWLVNRGNDRSLEAAGAKYLVCDIRDAAAFKTAVSGMTFDVVVDFFCFTPEHAKLDYEIFAGKTRHYIFLSTCAVYQKPTLSLPVREDMPMKNPYTLYARDKIACELYFLERYREDDFPVTIVRPSHTYGERVLVVGPLMGWFVPHWTLADRILRGKPIIVHDTGRTYWTLTHSDDFAVGLCGLMGNLQAVGHQFHITADTALPWNVVLETYGWVLGKAPEIVQVPTDFIAKRYPDLRGIIYGDMSENGIYDNSKIKRFVPDYRPRISLREGLERSVKWYDAHPGHKTVSGENNRMMDDLIREWQAL